jgi:hypothetical protein
MERMVTVPTTKPEAKAELADVMRAEMRGNVAKGTDRHHQDDPANKRTSR